MKLKRWLGLGLILIGIGFLTAFFLSRQKYTKTEKMYTRLRTAAEVSMMTSSREETGSRLDFQPLLAENPDTTAWLQIPGVELSLPVVQGQDDQHYLHIGFDGSNTPCGCLFLGAEGDIQNAYNVIYGHNLANGTMFGKLNSYRKESFGTQNPEFYLYTPAGDYRCVIFSCHEDTDSSDTYNTARILTSMEYGTFLQELKERSLYPIGPEPTASNRVLTLSTCSDPYSSGLKRFVVHAILEEMK